MLLFNDFYNSINISCACIISFMRYLLSIPEIDGVLTGVDTVEQLECNCSVADAGALDPEIMERIAAIVPELPEHLIRPGIWAARHWV